MEIAASASCAFYAEPDETRALQAIEHVKGSKGWQIVPVSLGDLTRPISSLPSVSGPLGTARTVVLLVSNISAKSHLFQEIVETAQKAGKRIIVIDLDSVGTGNIGGAIKDFADSVIAADDPALCDVAKADPIWRLPDGSPYPETKTKRVKKC
jgi:hypothetical protein